VETQEDYVMVTPNVTVVYAGFWRRFLAFVIDAIIMALLGFVIGFLTSAPSQSLVSMVIGWLYFAGMES
jgi:uncharacterized RDD family membrane protein YckC